MGAADEFGLRMREHLARAETENAAALDAAAGVLYRTIARDGLIHVAGTGHSTALVLETFYRAGGLACIRPVYDDRLSPLHGALACTEAERASGTGRELAAAARPEARDALVVFSNSGINPTPVEIAAAYAQAGAAVVAVVSREHMDRVAPRGTHKLDEVADIVLDNCSPYGDAAFPAGQHSVAALSSMTSVFLWNLMLARIATQAQEGGIELATWHSANTADGDAANAVTLRRYRDRIPHL